MPYTVRDTPALERRIDADLALVAATVRNGDPYLRALVLTGGFARGEGTVLDGVPQNDYDFVAVRGLGRPRTSYPAMAAGLGKRLGLHIDLAPVAAWRLRWAPRSVFWYETALRGRVLWGDDLLARIPVRDVADLDPAEALRFLVNRAAGLLLATEMEDAHAVRIQAAKAILAALDSHLLGMGKFAPSQTERWRILQRLLVSGKAPPDVVRMAESLAWAYRFKTDPASVPDRDPDEAWQDARSAILAAVPAALAHAGLKSLAAYGKRDGLVGRLVYHRRVHAVPGASRLVANPTGRVRVATLLLLEAASDGRVSRADAERAFEGIARVGEEPLRTLESLRAATLQ
jgi:hypothetical protein